MPLRLDDARALPTCPQQKQQKNKSAEPRFKIDHVALPMPETRQPERLAPRATSNRNGGRDHLGILGEIKSVHPGEIVGISMAVGLRPQADLAGRARKPSVGRDKKLLVVEKYREPVLAGRDTERMPRLARDVDVHASDQLSPSGGDAVQGDAVLERVGAYGVVVVRRSEPAEQAGRLVGLAGNGPKARRHVDVSSGEGTVNGERQAIIIWLGAGPRQSSTGFVINDRPFARPAVA